MAPGPGSPSSLGTASLWTSGPSGAWEVCLALAGPRAASDCLLAPRPCLPRAEHTSRAPACLRPRGPRGEHTSRAPVCLRPCGPQGEHASRAPVCLPCSWPCPLREVCRLARAQGRRTSERSVQGNARPSWDTHSRARRALVWKVTRSLGVRYSSPELHPCGRLCLFIPSRPQVKGGRGPQTLPCLSLKVPPAQQRGARPPPPHRRCC